jgi:hypothetical protein
MNDIVSPLDGALDVIFVVADDHKAGVVVQESVSSVIRED